jgi:hypothetical protein
MKLGARIELQIAAAKLLHELVHAVAIPRVVVEEFWIVRIARDSGGMIQQLVNRNLRAGVFAIVGQIVRHMTVELDGPFTYLLHHQHRRELFGDRSEAKFYVGRIRNVPFAIR